MIKLEKSLQLGSSLSILFLWYSLSFFFILFSNGSVLEIFFGGVLASWISDNPSSDKSSSDIDWNILPCVNSGKIGDLWFCSGVLNSINVIGSDFFIAFVYISISEDGICLVWKCVGFVSNGSQLCAFSKWCSYLL